MQPGVNFGVTDKNVEQLVIVKDAGPAANERRWLETLHLPGEHISDASLRPDYLRCARIVLQFASEAENLLVNVAIEHVFMDPRRLQKMLSADRSLRSVEEGDQ
jgi:hypothetical protein